MKANQRLKIILIVCAAMVLLPLLLMQLTNEVQWSGIDFVVAGVLLFGSGLILEFILRKTAGKKKLQWLLIILLIILFLLIWAQLAVGIFDTPLAGS
ncbi:hypothetical protein ABN763_17915 [Spongiivirga sp. MCCC 1A20706]|uniref:hypothetical protein n=1 Tax=Spongiivirga sp. MCCC 1A20706 TaxID=3160963 RepID=UPI0039776C7B